MASGAEQRHDTSRQDAQRTIAAAAVATEAGGSTRHAAVIGQELGRQAVVRCGDGAATAFADASDHPLVALAGSPA